MKSRESGDRGPAMDDLNLSPGVLKGKTKDELIALVQSLSAVHSAAGPVGEPSFYEAVFRESPDALLFVTPDRKIATVNAAFASLFGYKPEEMQGASTVILYADREEYERQGRLRYHIKSDRIPEPYTHRLRRKDGSEFIGESVGTLVRNAQGKVLGFLGVIRDVSGREAARQERRETERRLRDFSQVGVYRFWETDAEGRYIFRSSANAAFPRSGEAMLGDQQWTTHRFSADERAHKALMEKIARHEPYDDFHYSMMGDDGKRRYRRASAVPVFDLDGTFRGYRGVSIDETEEVLARREAETLSARFQAAIENFHAGFCLWGADMRFVACNEFYRRSTGRAETALRPGAHFEEFIRMRADEISEFRGVDREKWISDRLADFEQPVAWHEYRDPDETWYRITKQRLANGDTLFFLADITLAKLHEEELIQAKLEAESASRSKSEFLSNVSHELRTPLNAILGFAQIFERASPSMTTDKFARFGTIIRENGTYLLDLINGILDLAAIEAGRFNLSEDEVPLGSIVDEAFQLVRLRAAEDDVTLVNSMADSAPKVFVDRIKIKQVLVNLLTNAIKFTPGGGKVEIACARSETGDLDITIADTGIGMTPEDISIALEKFGRISRSRKGARDGIGLGLPLAKELIEAHGGALGIVSTPTVGTTIRLSLPEQRIIQ
jgi:two-component system, cell cycle sensor histidine kinase PleC